MLMITSDKNTFTKDILIQQAIQDRCCLEITYDDEFRIVEPHAHGEDDDHDMRLLVWEVFGPRPDWHMFRVAEITELALAPSGFSGPREDYQEDGSGLAIVHCAL